MPRILWKWFIKGQGFLAGFIQLSGQPDSGTFDLNCKVAHFPQTSPLQSVSRARLCLLARWLRGNQLFLFPAPSVYKWKMCVVSGGEMSTILDGRCKQKITSEPNRNESGIDWWQPRLIKEECVCVCVCACLYVCFNWCANSQPLRKWPLGGSSKWHTNIYCGHKHFCKNVNCDTGEMSDLRIVPVLLTAF